MKIKKGQQAGITTPLLKDLVKRSQVQSQQTLAKIKTVDSSPSVQPDLYQDAGSGYNANFVFPQD